MLLGDLYQDLLDHTPAENRKERRVCLDKMHATFDRALALAEQMPAIGAGGGGGGRKGRGGGAGGARVSKQDRQTMLISGHTNVGFALNDRFAAMREELDLRGGVFELRDGETEEQAEKRFREEREVRDQAS